MKGYSNFEIADNIKQITDALKEKYGDNIEIIDSIEEMCAKSYDILCLYISFGKYEDVDIVVGDLTTKRPNFTE